MLSIYNKLKPKFENVNFTGMGTISGEVTPGTTLIGRKIGNEAVTGNMVDSTSKVTGRVEGGLMIRIGSTFNGNWTTKLSGSESIVSDLEGTTLNRNLVGEHRLKYTTLSPGASVGGSIYSQNSTIPAGSSIGGVLHIKGSYFSNPLYTSGLVFLCGESGINGYNFSGGYISEACGFYKHDEVKEIQENEQMLTRIFEESFEIQNKVKVRRSQIHKNL